MVAVAMVLRFFMVGWQQKTATFARNFYMKTELWVIGKTNETYLTDGIAVYEKRLKHYLAFELKVFQDVKNAKNLSAAQLKEKEGDVFLSKIMPTDFVVLLDERGKMLTSMQFSSFWEQKSIQSQKNLVFIVGGAFGFSEAMYARANEKISLSAMTFSHQMIRLFFVEQLYRAMTILKNEPYHNE
jgi:23S rRNA (pseudouridine1915-N3)-methyltransferase